MNIVKRLLNVVVLAAVALLFLGGAYGVADVYEQLAVRKQDCERVLGLEAVQAKIEDGQRKPITDIETITEAMRLECARDIRIEGLYEAGSDLLQASIFLILIVVVLNYVMFGELTLWNKVRASNNS
jgi:hypothetical protein